MTDPNDDTISSEIGLVVNWFWRDIAQMNELVTALAAAADRNHNCSSAYVLLAESAVNILDPFNRAQKAATSFARQAKPKSPKGKKKRP